MSWASGRLEKMEIDPTTAMSVQQSRHLCAVLHTLWHEVRRYRITSSLFGSVLSRRDNTPPDALVMRIIQPKQFSSAATQHGIEMEPVAITRYMKHQHSNGHPDLCVCSAGFFVSTSHPFLGASPDGSVYDPSNLNDPYGFLEVKCPYKACDITPADACLMSDFFCTVKDGTGNVKLKESHAYYCQIQGQMAIGCRPWCDFVICTNKGLNVECVSFNPTFWNNVLLPKLFMITV